MALKAEIFQDESKDIYFQPKIVLAFSDDDKGCFDPFDMSQDSNLHFSLITLP